ncbi:CYTH and CHAD domain-containing protein [Jatrophihabitans telluris]|uniref:CYTH and CHAD domain-containing protein n=1 Tax=Jatrophihabitans telluris TaxID=2038343 RepID=A0ABY4R1C6_9ACTN|nr:CYTH and CHAD domain-containing protein [Jatrophihabitans telluris]UQX89515.1 CYTH and CHAD domain-containing protein [Jatrophihabitans telluris]
MADQEREIESKFDVAPDFLLGDLTSLIGPEDSLAITDNQLVSVYYDTPQADLHRSRLTLRRRTGTSDTGWHLKVPGEGFRTELRWPLEGNAGMPEELRRLIAPFTHGIEVTEIIRLRITRTRHRIADGHGDLRMEFADDQVRADALELPVHTRRWHEVEVELGPSGTAADLDASAELLLSRGAFVSRSGSKLTRALYGQSRRSVPADTAGGVLLDYLDTQADAITAGHFAISLMPFDPEATDEPHEAVHKTRVGIRRYRAALRVFAPMVDRSRAARLDAELKWLAAELGEVRDREVLRIRLQRAVEDLPAYLIVGPVARQIDEILLAELHEHADTVLRIMSEPRYHDLLDELAQWRVDPPFTEAADAPTSELAGYVRAARKTLARRMKRASAPNAPDELLHRARKGGKRARYAAEATADVLGSQASRLAKRATKLQTLLGEHQDAVVATALLRRIADQLAERGENAFSYGVLVAEQRRVAAESRAAAQDAAQT